MSEQHTDTVVREGTVTLGSRQNGYQTFHVREWSDGSVQYHLGKLARTSDGWVELMASLRSQVRWE